MSITFPVNVCKFYYTILAPRKTESNSIEEKSLNQPTIRMSEFQNPKKVSTCSLLIV